ncbi:MAG TPA: twin-arginine translocation signal domain-containing protein, partial [Thermoanaerobaculia bacterium]|nr:twin-arginine translocation signal domain-containing protein [Thermoanaerobaculia bacterium]
MKPNELIPGPEASAVDRREFLRVGGALAAAGALATTACRQPQEATIPFNDMSEKMVDGQGLPRYFASVLYGSPVLVRTREGRPILVTASPNDRSGRGLALGHHAALMDLYDPDRAAGPVWVRRGAG